MKLAKFERKEAERTGFTLEEFRRQFAVTPCECGKKKCDGWQVRYRFRAERRRELRMPRVDAIYPDGSVEVS